MNLPRDNNNDDGRQQDSDEEDSTYDSDIATELEDEDRRTDEWPASPSHTRGFSFSFFFLPLTC